MSVSRVSPRDAAGGSRGCSQPISGWGVSTLAQWVQGALNLPRVTVPCCLSPSLTAGVHRPNGASVAVPHAAPRQPPCRALLLSRAISRLSFVP